MNILLVSPHYRRVTKSFPMLGLCYISAVLKSRGHNVRLLDFSIIELKEKVIYEKLKEFRPGLVGISISTTHLEDVAKRIAGIIKTSLDIPIIAGGTAVTVAPADFINCRDIDIVCIGEGEYAMLELADRINDQKDYTDVKNLWVKRNGMMAKNEIRPLIKDLDTLPFADITLFPRTSNVFIIASRGCPYDCNYCINKELRRLYGAAGYRRLRSPKSVISEILKLKKEHFYEHIWFHDEDFPYDRKWLNRFSELYIQSGINLPFSINLRSEHCSEELMRLLKKAGLCEIRMGIESGDENIRRNQLNRLMSDKDIKAAFQRVKKYHIIRRSYNMIGIPGETKESVYKTILLNLELGVEWIQWAILQPYPGTAFGEECARKGYLTKEIRSLLNFGESNIRTEYLSPEDTKDLFLLCRFIGKHRRFFALLLKLTGPIIKIMFDIILFIISLRRIRRRFLS